MYSALKEVDLDGDNSLIVMPLARVLVEERIRIGNLTIFPPRELNLEELGLQFEEADMAVSSEIPPEGKVGSLRDAIWKVTGFSAKILRRSATVCFAATIDWDEVENGNHKSDSALLNRLSNMTERTFDALRMRHCDLDFPGSLPGAAGTWEGPQDFVGALVFNPANGMSRLMAGAAPSYSAITSGIGLDMNECTEVVIPSHEDGPVGAIAAHALSLFSDALHARNDTSKFIRVMTLLEFLASPDEYQSWKKVKGDLACHLANSKAEYHQMLGELRSLTSDVDANKEQIGYRTLVVHHGKFLDDIIPDEKERGKLFRRLQKICQAVIEDMIVHGQMTWSEFEAYRGQLKARIGV